MSSIILKITQELKILKNQFRLPQIGLFFLFLAGGLILFWVNPETIRIYIPCLINKYTGLYCPGCGATRALHHLLHGRFLWAFRYNPLFVIGLVGIAVLSLNRVLFRVTGIAIFPKVNMNARWLWIITVIAIIFGILRNIPAHPFSLLAPHCPY